MNVVEGSFKSTTFNNAAILQMSIWTKTECFGNNSLEDKKMAAPVVKEVAKLTP